MSPERRLVVHRAWKAAESRYGPVVHACPPNGSGLLPCCGRSPFEVPKWHRISLMGDTVTCGKETI